MNEKRYGSNKFTKTFFLLSLIVGIASVFLLDFYFEESMPNYVQLSYYKYFVIVVIMLCLVIGCNKKNRIIFNKIAIVIIETLLVTFMYMTVINDFDGKIFLVSIIALIVVIPFLTIRMVSVATILFWTAATVVFYLRTLNPGIELPVFLFFTIFPPILILVISLEKTKMAMEMKKMAMYDQLTDIPNREYTKQLVEEKIQGGHPFGFLFIDLDNFKEINDKYGHTEGDRILKSVASSFKRDVRENDLVGRLCGDEFLIMLMNCEDRKGVENVFERISTGFDVKIRNEYITYSVGAVMFPGDASDYREILKKSDIAMYKSKAKGKNQLCFYDDDCDYYLYVKD